MLADTLAKLATTCPACGRLHEAGIDQPRPPKCLNLACLAPLTWPKASRPRLSKLAKQASNGKVPHPATTGTTTPAGIEANDRHADPDAWLNRQRAKEFSGETKRQAAKAAPDFGDDVPQDTGQVVRCGLDLIHPHPKNRRPKSDAVKALAESFQDPDAKQLQPILVRVPPKGSAYKLADGHVQIVFGERRYQAAKLAGWESIEARIRTDLDDAATLSLMAEENAKRQDLNPIEKARLIESLCDPAETGGLPLTREAAAKRVGLTSGSAASNLVRLLELPKMWQDRVADLELPESFARLLLPVLPLKAVMAELEREWKTRGEPYDSWETPNAFASREILEGQIQSIIDDECSMVFPDRKDRDAIDTSSAATQKALGIVEMQLPTGGNRKLERVHVVTNVKAYENLRNEQYAWRSKVQAEKSGRDEKPAPRERILSPAEQKHRNADRTRQLSERIAAWRHQLLRRELVRKIEKHEDNGGRLVLAYAAAPAYRGPSIADLLQSATKVRSQSSGGRSHYWPAVARMDDMTADKDVVSVMAIALLRHQTEDIKYPTLPHGLVDGFAADLAIDVKAAWEGLQDAGDVRYDGEFVEQFLLLHQTEQLRDLGKELGVYLDDAKNRGVMVKLLMGKISHTSRLRFPKSIKPLAIAGSPKAKKRKGK